MVSFLSRGALRGVRKAVVYVCSAAILCGVSRSAAAAVDQYIGKPIASVDLTVEGRPTNDAAVLSVLETQGRSTSIGDRRTRKHRPLVQPGSF